MKMTKKVLRGNVCKSVMRQEDTNECFVENIKPVNSIKKN